jgi:hypothetical protein
VAERDVSAGAGTRVGRAHRLARDDQSVAHPGADRHDRETGQVLSGAEPALGLREGDDVVLDRDGHADTPREFIGERDVMPLQEGRLRDDPVAHKTAEADSDAREVGHRKFLDAAHHRIKNRRGAPVAERVFAPGHGVGTHSGGNRVEVVTGQLDSNEAPGVRGNVEGA